MMLSPMGSMQSPGAGGAAFPPQPVLTETLPLHEQRTRTTSRAVQLAPGEPGCTCQCHLFRREQGSLDLAMLQQVLRHDPPCMHFVACCCVQHERCGLGPRAAHCGMHDQCAQSIKVRSILAFTALVVSS